MTRIGSGNVKVTLPAYQASSALRILTDHADLLGLQEWGHNRDHLLARTGSLHKGPLLSKPKADTSGWTWARPRLGLGGPVGARSPARLLGCHPVVLHAPGHVEGTAQTGAARKAFLGASIATVTRWELAGEHVVAIDFHLTANVDDAPKSASIGRYRTNLPLRVMRHRRERRRLERLVERHLRKGRRVVAIGDSNFLHMPIAGLTGWWLHPGSEHEGTEGWRAIDCVSASWGVPDKVRILTSKSDHRHPVAEWDR